MIYNYIISAPLEYIYFLGNPSKLSKKDYFLQISNNVSSFCVLMYSIHILNVPDF